MKHKDIQKSFQNKNLGLQNKKVVVVTYTHNEGGKPSYLAGPSQDLKHYLIPRVKELLFVEQPISFSEDLSATAEWYIQAKLEKRFRFPMPSLPKTMRRPDIDSHILAYLIFKIRDILSSLYFLFRVPRRFDCYIGVEAINAILGIFLKIVGKVRLTVYDVIDYSPKRFQNSFLNRLYHWLDNCCVRGAQFSWNQTKLVMQHRLTKGIQKETQLIKPTGVDGEKLGSLDWSQIKTNQMVYVGGIYNRDGVDLLIESLPEIQSAIHDIQLLIIGYGDQLDRITRRTKELGLQEHVMRNKIPFQGFWNGTIYLFKLPFKFFEQDIILCNGT